MNATYGYENPSVCWARESSSFSHTEWSVTVLFAVPQPCHGVNLRPASRPHAVTGTQPVARRVSLKTQHSQLTPPPPVCLQSRGLVARALRVCGAPPVFAPSLATTFSKTHRLYLTGIDSDSPPILARSGGHTPLDEGGDGLREDVRVGGVGWEDPVGGAGPRCSPGGGDPSEETLAQVQCGGHTVR